MMPASEDAPAAGEMGTEPPHGDATSGAVAAGVGSNPASVTGNAAETTINDQTTTPPSPDHLAFLQSLPDGAFGFGLMVYGDRVEEDGLLEAAHVLRHHDSYLDYRTNVLALHRAICAQVERIFGCRYAPERPVADSTEVQTSPAHPHRLYVRKSSLRCFRDWRPLPEGRYFYAELERLLAHFERQIIALHPAATRELILRERLVQYEVAILPLLLVYLSGLPLADTATLPR